jgi:hypothetical protein
VDGVPLTSYEPEDRRLGSEALDRILTIFEHPAGCTGHFVESLNVVWVDGLSDLEGPDEGLLNWGPQRLEPRALAHHLTHIWFTVNVTPRTSRESYLRAAFANYGDLLWIEHTNGVDARDAMMAAMYGDLGTRTDAPADPSRIAGNKLCSSGPVPACPPRDRRRRDVLRDPSPGSSSSTGRPRASTTSSPSPSS